MTLPKKLAEDDGITRTKAECVGCGYCCQKAPCVAGSSIYGLKDGTCAGLQWNPKAMRYYCLLILETTGQANKVAREGLAIGEGCCSPMFNTQRESAVERQRESEG